MPKVQAGAPKVQFEVKAICFDLWVAPNYASTALLAGLVRKVPALTFLRKTLCKRSGNALENASENAVWGAAGAPQRGEASREKVRHREKTLRNVGGFRIIWSVGSWYGIEFNLNYNIIMMIIITATIIILKFNM